MDRSNHRELVRLIVASLLLIGGILLVFPSNPVQAVRAAPAVTPAQAPAVAAASVP